MAKYLDATGLQQVWNMAKSTFLKLSGGTITTTSTVPLKLTTSANYNYISFGASSTNKGEIGYYHNGPGGVGEMYMQVYGTGNPTLSISENGNGYVGNNIILHSGNYTSYTVKKDGTGASGTWGISVSGGAAYLNRTTYSPQGTTVGDYKNALVASSLSNKNGNWTTVDYNFIYNFDNDSASATGGGSYSMMTIGGYQSTAYNQYLISCHSDMSLGVVGRGSNNWTGIKWLSFKGDQIDWSVITSKPTYATRWPSWSEVTDKPSTFSPSSHSHDSSYLKYSGSWSSSESHDSTTSTGMVFAYHNHGVPGSWGTLTTFAAYSGSSYNFQLFGDGWSNEFYFRTRSADNGQHEWRKVIHEGNIGSQSVSYAASAGSVAWGNVSGKPSTFTPSTHTHDYLPLSGGLLSNSTYNILRINTTSPDGNLIYFSTNNTYTSSVGLWAGVTGVWDEGGGGAGLGIVKSTQKPVYRSSLGGTQYELWHSGNDGSGSGLDADTLDGYHSSTLYTSVGDWIDKVGHTYTVTIQGDSNTYYPVVIDGSSDKRCRNQISIWKNLGSTTASYPSNHPNGTASLWLLYEGRNIGWDGNGGYWKTWYKSQNYSTLVSDAQRGAGPVGALIVWLRGGGTVYYVSTTFAATVNVYLEETNLYNDTYPAIVSPRTDIGNGGILTDTYYGSVTGSAASATTASNVAWSGVSSKPDTATRWPSWNEVTGKPSTFTPTSHNHDDRYLRKDTDVGIGTTTPQVKLHVNGKFHVYYATESAPTNDLFASSFASFGEYNDDALWIGKDTSSSIWLQAAYKIPSTAKYKLLLNPLGGNVGIGTSSPSEQLEVSGKIKATSFIKSGGTSSQFLKADGSVDSNSYALTSNIPTNTNQLTNGAGFITSSGSCASATTAGKLAKTTYSPAGDTVADYKTALVASTLSNTNGNWTTVPYNFVHKLDQDGAEATWNGTYSMITIGGYQSTTYNQYLVSCHGGMNLGVIGRSSNQWTGVRWIMYKDDNLDWSQIVNKPTELTSTEIDNIIV